ncbi:hypothetical protein QE357_001694 [Siphonobacter sp. BAB-5404]|nr:hypothetical protein [Siphonobacter sp. SORGH_AS_0500]
MNMIGVRMNQYIYSLKDFTSSKFLNFQLSVYRFQLGKDAMH